MPNFDRLKNLSGKAEIVGVAESDAIGRVPDRSPLALHAEAALNALETQMLLGNPKPAKKREQSGDAGKKRPA